MKTHTIAVAVVTFVLGGLVGHLITVPSQGGANPVAAHISSLEITLSAARMPVESADAI